MNLKKTTVFRSLRTQITLAVMATGLLILLSIFVILYPLERERRIQRLERIQVYINTLFEQNREQLANEIYARQIQALDLSLEQIQQQEGISHVMVYDLDGKRMAAFPHTGLNAPALKELDIEALPSDPLFQESTVDGSPYAQYISPIEVIGVHVGFIRILYDLSAFHQEIQLSLLFSASLILVMGAIIILLNLFLRHAVIRPTTQLIHGMETLQNGDLETRITLRTSDEMSRVADTFNMMAEQLDRQHRELTDAVAGQERYSRELRQANLDLEELNATLEERVRERTGELTRANEQLQQEMTQRQQAYREKQKMEKALIRSKKMETLGLMAGGVAHDLNNVLSGIVSYPDLLLMDLDRDDPMFEMISTIRDSGQKAAAIVQDLLTLTRRGVVNSVVMQPGDLIEEYLASPEHRKIMLSHPRVHLKTRVDDDLACLSGSAVHLKKTLMNLVSNAAEAQPQGGAVSITARNRHLDAPLQGYQQIPAGEYVMISVSDTGVGISDTEKEHIFEPFYTRKAMGRSGTGLGMAVVWGTMQDHDGFIDINSCVGEGTTFELYFPATTDLPAPAKQTPDLTGLQGQGQCILVVDDLEEQLTLCSLFLKKLGYDPVTADSGEAAVTYLENHTVDLVILDMVMDPGMDGLDTYRKIKEIHPDQKAVVASGYAENERVKLLQQLGAGAYIKKPYTIETLGRAVKSELAA